MTHTLHARKIEDQTWYYRLWSERASQYSTGALTRAEMLRHLTGEVPVPDQVRWSPPPSVGNTDTQTFSPPAPYTPFVPISVEEAFARLHTVQRLRAIDRPDVFVQDLGGKQNDLLFGWLPEKGRPSPVEEPSSEE